MATNAFDFMKSCTYDAEITSVTDNAYTRIDWMTVLNEYRLNNKYVDVTVRLRDDTVSYVHSVVLCAHSNMYDGMFSSGMIESRTKTIDMTAYDPVLVNQVIDFMYTYDISLTRYNIIELFTISHNNAFDKLTNLCCKYICESITADNVHCVYELADMTASTFMMDGIVTYMATHISRISDMDDTLVRLQYHQVKTILSYKRRGAYVNRSQRAFDRLHCLLQYITHGHSQHSIAKECKMISDICYIPARARQQLLDLYPDAKKDITKLYKKHINRMPFELYNPYQSELKVYDLHIIDTECTNPSVYPDDHDNVSSYEYVSKIALKFGTRTNITECKHVSILCKIKLDYATGKHVRIGSSNTVNHVFHNNVAIPGIYNTYDITLRPQKHERIIDITLYKIDTYIESITITSNITSYGPYGTCSADSTRISVLPTEFVNRTTDDVYLHNICYTVCNTNQINKLLFKWIAG